MRQCSGEELTGGCIVVEEIRHGSETIVESEEKNKEQRAEDM
jgi:hypothetical protein